MIEHLVRDTQIFCVAMEVDYELFGALEAREEQTWDVVFVQR